jgi:hypothetical protein
MFFYQGCIIRTSRYTKSVNIYVLLGILLRQIEFRRVDWSRRLMHSTWFMTVIVSFVRVHSRRGKFLNILQPHPERNAYWWRVWGGGSSQSCPTLGFLCVCGEGGPDKSVKLNSIPRRSSFLFWEDRYRNWGDKKW